ncbi:MAG TPA: MiaB/RimO family radical SAM methylthiotransferase [Tepidisphaeraceae bacterium]|nr:MiaB/RimO family radical SAM methylthiotransferase [Tepidisphaeraceae bacterium]
MKRKLFLETFGCQMNQLDSELVLGQLRAQGYEAVPDREGADVIIYNTCSVREHAEQKVWSRLGELRERKAREPGLVIGVIGCMAERDGTNLFKKYPHVDLLCGPGELDKLAGMVHNAAVAAAAIADGEVLTDRPGKQVALMGASSRRSSTLAAAEDHLELLDLSRSISPGEMPAQAYVRITRGCNKFCTYCVVPHTRGPEVHRPPGNIIEEVKKLVAGGVREVTLLGQTVNHYCHVDESGRKTTFADLLYQVHEAVPDLPRLRFVTSFPRDFSDEALQAMRDCRRICRYLHIPAQSGSDRILRLMNRGYTAESYRALIGRAREMMPDICLASDFIVGFPTETDADFAATVDLLRECRFKNSFIFKYSPRPGTVAIDRFADDVPEEIKRRRNSELLEVQRQVTQANNRDVIGVRATVLVESHSRLAAKPVYATAGTVELGWERRRTSAGTEQVQLIGRTAGDQIVAFDGDSDLVGELVEVEIVSAKNLTLFGRLRASRGP